MKLDPTRACTVAHLEARFVADEADQLTTQRGSTRGGAARVPAWSNLVPDIARRVQVAFPDAETLTREPERWLRGVDGIEAAIVEKSPRYHPIGAGMGTDDHERITRVLAQALDGEAELCAPLTRVPRTTKTEAHGLEEDLRDTPGEVRLAGLEASIGKNVTVEVYWDTEGIRDMLVDCVHSVLVRPRPVLVAAPEHKAAPTQPPRLLSLFDAQGGPDVTHPGGAPAEGNAGSPGDDSVDDGQGESSRDGARLRRPRVRAEEPAPEPAPESQDIPLPGGGRLRVVTRRLGELASPLPQVDGHLHTVHTNVQTRATQIMQTLGVATEPTVALVELAHYNDPRSPQLRREFGPRRDPKRAIRLGMARTERVTQFIAPNIPGDLREKCLSTVRDGLRHLGYLPHPIGFQRRSVAHDLPSDLLVAAVWCVRLTKKTGFVRVYFPVVVVMHTEQSRIMTWLPDGKGLRPYRQALVDITLMDPQTVNRKNRAAALQQLHQFLMRDLPALGARNMAVLTMAQNARETWPGIANQHLVWDAVRFEARDPAVPLTGRLEDLRLIRLRTSQQGETPEYFVPGAQANTFVQGVWRDPMNERLFYDVARKPHTMTGKRQGKGIDPTERYTVPSLLEILPVAVAGAHEIDLWPDVIDQWRRMSILTNDMTLLPLPLDLAEKMEEYATVIGAWIFPEEWLEDDGDGDEDEEDGDDDEEEENAGFQQLEFTF